MESEQIGPGRTPTPPGATGGDLSRAIGQLVKETEQDVFRFMLRRTGQPALAWDLTQMTFLRIWKARGQFDSSRNTHAWVMRIASNVEASHYRSDNAQKRGRPHSLDASVAAAAAEDGDGAASAGPIDTRAQSPVDKLVRDEAVAAMDKAAEGLSENDQALYRLRRDGLTSNEIAERTGRTAGAVATALTRIYKKLRVTIAAHEP